MKPFVNLSVVAAYETGSPVCELPARTATWEPLLLRPDGDDRCYLTLSRHVQEVELPPDEERSVRAAISAESYNLLDIPESDASAMIEALNAPLGYGLLITDTGAALDADAWTRLCRTSEFSALANPTITLQAEVIVSSSPAVCG